MEQHCEEVLKEDIDHLKKELNSLHSMFKLSIKDHDLDTVDRIVTRIIDTRTKIELLTNVINKNV